MQEAFLDWGSHADDALVINGRHRQAAQGRDVISHESRLALMGCCLMSCWRLANNNP